MTLRSDQNQQPGQRPTRSTFLPIAVDLLDRLDSRAEALAQMLPKKDLRAAV